MAFPTIPTTGAGRVLVANQLNTTATRTFPSLSGLTKNSGDLLIAICVAYQTSTGTDAAFSGWTGSFTEFHDSATSTTMAIGMAYKWSTGSETGTFSVTQAGTITGDASFILLSIPGAHASTPPEAGSRASGTTGAADPASFNPGAWDVEDTLWISVVGSGCTNISGSWDGTGTTAPTNYTNRVDTNASDTSVIGDCEAAVAFRQLNASSENVGTAGVDISNARNAAVVIAVRPVPAPNQGSASGAIALAGSSTGVTSRAGAGTGTIAWAGTAQGTTLRNGSSTGSINWAGSSTGVRTPKGAPTGSISWVGTANGEAPVDTPDGQATGSITWAGSAAGSALHHGAVSGSITWVGNATGQSIHAGSATGNLAWVGSATGIALYEGAGAGDLAWSGVATGQIPTQGPWWFRNLAAFTPTGGYERATPGYVKRVPEHNGGE